jgi:hypothetical protein
MTPADLRRLHKYMLEIEKISAVSAEMRAVGDSEWPSSRTSRRRGVEWNCGNSWRIKVGLRQNLCQPFGSNGRDHEKES